MGVWNYNDEYLLRESEHELSVSRLIELRDVAAERRGLSSNLSMERLAHIILGAEGVEKPVCIGMSNWEAYWLSDEQVQYACVDAFISFSLEKELQAWD